MIPGETIYSGAALVCPDCQREVPPRWVLHRLRRLSLRSCPLP